MFGIDADAIDERNDGRGDDARDLFFHSDGTEVTQMNVDLAVREQHHDDEARPPMNRDAVERQCERGTKLTLQLRKLHLEKLSTHELVHFAFAGPPNRHKILILFLGLELLGV
eukprot:Amastigsp_a508856_265.p4 type:complete len:113 gc:universal Amastigsp_a508856_265:1397-1059(-)